MNFILQQTLLIEVPNAEYLQTDCEECEAACYDHQKPREDALWKGHEQCGGYYKRVRNEWIG